MTVRNDKPSPVPGARMRGGHLLHRRGLMAGAAALGLAGCAANAGSDRFARIDARVHRAIADGQTPGAVVAIGHGGALVYGRTFGNRALVPSPEPLTWQTRFDMASLTKVLATAPSVMQFWERGVFQLDDPVVRYWPEFAANGKGAITIRMLLTHYSGLKPDLPLDTPWAGRETAVRLILESTPDRSPGTQFVYSDINFLTLGILVERWSGQTLADYVQGNVLGPLGMTQSGFQPSGSLRPMIAPTQFDEHGAMMRGVVHDPTSRRMDGIAGHAGLFSDINDTCLYAQALLDRRAGRPSTYPLQMRTVQMMTTPQQPDPHAADKRGLGWDIDTPFSSPRGDVFPKSSFGHTGFTGTSLWMDPASDTFVAILTNRVHPRGGHSVVALRHDVATLAGQALGLTS
ncbi:serine hydrolase domain-containing protein [Tanticharoenia sakaeratensis]|uniref:Beta-lactamase n=1 Tax=Tanticharoenia sakaeratensis NBRC 103193 TaxID=1231623 RepID=A0A0D6MJI4_9PROT|nr:beta-lactamase [Tanticharoenia sakaeratensis NBRC 103193]GBQ22301.1 beta-lactamase [Tanticharoenia sakaeratensis NBRC 103193]